MTMSSSPSLTEAIGPRRTSAADSPMSGGLALEDGGTIEGAAFFLCRAGTVEDVRRKARELGLIEAGLRRNALP
jgi:hypothetical protein